MVSKRTLQLECAVRHGITLLSLTACLFAHPGSAGLVRRSGSQGVVGPSCRDKCGSTEVQDTLTGRCTCDNHCLLRKDCCADYLVACPPQEPPLPSSFNRGRRSPASEDEEEFFIDYEEEYRLEEEAIRGDRGRLPAAYPELFSNTAMLHDGSSPGSNGRRARSASVTTEPPAAADDAGSAESEEELEPPTRPTKRTLPPSGVDNPYGYPSTQDGGPPVLAVSESLADAKAGRNGGGGTWDKASTTAAVGVGVACVGALMAATMLVVLKKRRVTYAQSLEAYTISSSGSAMGRSRISRRFSTDVSASGVVVE
eukprot:m.465565 g.465565  ORF g.465565 m.465565 type:complete len:312 (+) comp24325_c0_seq1:365-1300(+)